MCSDSVSLTCLASDIALEFPSFLNADEEHQFQCPFEAADKKQLYD